MEHIYKETEYANEVVPSLTARTNDILHMILDLKLGKEVDLYELQTMVLDMYRDEMQFVHVIGNLYARLEEKQRKTIEIPKFMFKKEKEAQ